MRLRRKIALLAAALLTACSSSGGGSGRGAGPAPGKSGLPSHSYDVVIYMCTAVAQNSACGGTAATSAQVDAVRAGLSSDADVAEYHYLTEQDAYRVGQAVLAPNIAGQIRPGDLPASFLVALTHPGDPARAALESRFGHAPGVENVRPCSPRIKQCQVSFLRKLKLVH